MPRLTSDLEFNRGRLRDEDVVNSAESVPGQDEQQRGASQEQRQHGSPAQVP